MGLSINTNVAALNAYRNLGTTQGDLSKSLEKLSSGLRINRAADDAAGLAISEGLRAQIGGTKQAVRNAQDGISVVQTAEGALTETHSILQRMRTLSVQASNDGGLSTGAKSNIQDELNQLGTELDRIAKTTQFNGAKLLDGSYNGTFHVGANIGADNQISVKLQTADIAALGVATVTGAGGLSSGGLGLSNLSITGADVTVSRTATAADVRSAVTAVTSTFTTTGTKADAAEGLAAINTAFGTSAASVGDLETALRTSTGNASLTVTQDGTNNVTVSAGQSGADYTLAPVNAAGGTLVAGVTGQTAIAVGDTITETVSAAEGAINRIDDAIGAVSKVRSQLGAVQNRFDHTINNLNVAVENLSASESRIRDTDMAQEMVQFTRSQILSQAGTAMLAQAKNLPQSVLSLLQ